MKKITLRQLPAVSLNTSYALEHTDGTLTHYVTAWQNNMPGADGPEAALKEHFTKELGEEIELVILDRPGESKELKEMGDALRTRLLPEEYFGAKAIRDLKQRKTDGTLYMYNKNVSKLPDWLANLQYKVGKWIDTKLFGTINALTLRPINYLLSRLYGYTKEHNRLTAILYGPEPESDEVSDYESYLDVVAKASNDLEALEAKIANSFFLPTLSTSFGGRNFCRACSPVAYLAIACGEEDLEDAIALIGDELDTAASRGLIFGHLSMPSMIELMNLSGNGKKIYAVYVFFIPNYDRLLELTHKTPLEAVGGPDPLLKELGFKTSVLEGGVNWLNGEDPYTKLVIKTVYVGEEKMKSDQQALIDAHVAQQEAQKRIAERKAKERGEI